LHILHSQLLPLLKEVYPYLYDNSVYYDDVIKKLTALTPSEWLNWANKKTAPAFQFSKYGACDYIEANFTNIDIHYDCILLSLEGKILMETYGQQFNFFKYTMIQTFRQWRIAGALRVSISG